MKDFFVYRTVRGLTIAFLIVISAIFAFVGAGAAWAGKNSPVEVGFISVPPTGNFQNVLLNVQSVRINPKATAGPGNGGFQNIPTPPGIGGAQQGAELQIDLNTSQNVPQLFNTANVKAGSYKLAEIQLDTTNPGSLIPNCPTAPPVGGTKTTNEGCINYPIQLANGNVISTPITSPDGKSGFSASAGSLAQLLLQVNMTITQAPTTAGAPYIVSVTLSQVTTSVLGNVTGMVAVTGSGGTGTSKIRKLAVSAEAIGTSTVVATSQVKNGMFNLALPAAGGSGSVLGFGTLYDLAIAGGADTYAAQRLPPLYPGQTITAGFSNGKAPPGFQFNLMGGQTLGTITGNISSNCTKNTPIVGATLELLIPPGDNVTNNPSTIDCSNPAMAAQCITVATANTDNAGNFPLPGMITTPAEFLNVPPPPTKSPNGAYGMKITAPGYDPQFVQVRPTATGKKAGCAPTGSTNTTTFTPCNLLMNSGFISGTVPIVPPNPGQTALIQVFAEDHGTNTIESALPMPLRVRSGTGSVMFTLNVPTSATVPQGYDLFATTIDTFQGVSDPFPGHTIAVKAGVAAPGPATGSGMCQSTTGADFATDQTITCNGHGSIVGTVANPDLGTSVLLSKEDPDAMESVQLATSLVQNQLPNPNSTDNYAFCVPADTYLLQTVEMPMPIPSVVPSVAPTPEPTGSPTVSVTIPPAPHVGGPSATPTPAIKCPTTCSNPDGTCPGLCNTVTQPLP